jgi:hypothetical protein
MRLSEKFNAVPAFLFALIVVGFLPSSAASMVQTGTPGFVASPTSIDFGPSAVGQITEHAFPFHLTVSNNGTGPLTSNWTINPVGEFEPTVQTSLSVPDPFTINAGASTGADFIFAPSAPGTRTAQFVSTDNAPGSPHTVQFTGTGVAVPAGDFTIIADPSLPPVVNVTAGSPKTFAVWLLGNSQGSNIDVMPVQCSGGPSHTSCSLDDTAPTILSFSVTPRQKIMVTVTVPSGGAVQNFPGLWWCFPLACLVTGMLLLVFNKRREWRFALAMATLALAIFLVSCGGGSSGGSSSPLVLTATGTSGTHTLSIPLNVQ